ncbi:MAG: glycosyltransferase family 39 protein [Anaerolineae bacterium]|nr:glycosyltransferase family 39 protein [Anaerolineae bacterium]
MLGGILLVAFGLRARGIDYGLPQIAHMEEPFYTDAAHDLACDRDLDSSLLQLHTYVYAVATKISDELHLFSCKAPHTNNVEMLDTPPELVMIGRWVSITLAVVGIFLLYHVGRRLYSVEIGLLAALFTAVNFLHVRESQHGTPDISATTLVLGALLSYIVIAQKRAGRGHYIVAGLVTALAINTRITLVLLMFPLTFAHLTAVGLLEERNWLRLRRWFAAVLDVRVWWAALVFMATLLLANAQIWVNPVGYLRYWRDFLSLSRQGGFGNLRVDPLPAPLFYLRAIEWGSGLVLALLMALALLWLLRRRTLGDKLLISFVLPYFIVASITSVYFARYIIPILPLLGLFAARLIWEVLPQKRRAVWLTAVLVLLLAIPMQRVLRYGYLQSQTDTRTFARDWVYNNVPEGSKIAMEWHSPEIDSERYDVTFVDFYGLSVDNLDTYRQNGIEYLIVTSFTRDAEMLQPAAQLHKSTFYENLALQEELIYEIKPYSGDQPPYQIDQVLGPITYLDWFDRPGPTVQIYRIAANTDPASPG